jgi:glutamate-1-semialdehyde aminotransferase
VTRDTVSERYRSILPGPRERWERARGVIRRGITHAGRLRGPFPLCVARATGRRTWDTDGPEGVDHWMARDALFLGPSHPVLAGAVHGWGSAVHTAREIGETTQAAGRAVADREAAGAL